MNYNAITHNRQLAKEISRKIDSGELALEEGIQRAKDNATPFFFPSSYTRKPRVVSDEAYLLACQILHVDPKEPEDTIQRNSEYWLWHRLAMVEWAKRALTFPMDMLYSGFPDPTERVG